jgi:eukaryotic-like serine/threonine-protein kinase
MPLTLDAALTGLPAALAGEFELEHELGRGGMGVVFRARDIVLDRPVALKVLPPSLGENAEVRTRFLREARTAGQLSHPNIVPVHRADEREGYAFFAMGLVDGETLGARVKDRGPLPPNDVVRHLREVAWALAYAHARGVIHRDVKPENIMIERLTNRALVTDFGIARSERAANLTSEGHIVGTAHFMSPEQIQGGAIDGRSDLYALGVVGFFLLSGRLPFEGDAAPAVLVAHVTRPAPALLSVAPRVPRPLAAVIDRCLAKDPAQRFANGEELSEALGKAMEGVAAAPAVVSGAHQLLSEDQAALVWKRAAQLQAEAAARLERETRTNASRSLGTDVAAAGTGAAAPGVPPTSTFRVQDVEAAAVEAGISQRFVALALSELPSGDALASGDEEGGLRDRVGSALIGRVQRSLSISRVIRAPAREVLQAIGRTFQGLPYRMSLRDQIGAHPLDGGILVFKVPDMDASGVSAFTWLRYGLGARELRATLRTLEHDRGATEVTVFADLRPGLNSNVWGYSGISFGVAASSASAGVFIGMQAMALTGLIVAAPAAITGLAGAAIAVALSRAFYRGEVRWATKELDDLLHAIDGTLRSRSIFDADPPVLPPPRAGGDAVGWIASVG